MQSIMFSIEHKSIHFLFVLVTPWRMYTQKTYSHEMIRSNDELTSGDNFELNNLHSRVLSAPQPWNAGISAQPPTMGLCLRSENFGPAKSSSTTMLSCFESPASAFYAAEHCMGFQQRGCDVSTSSDCSQPSKACDTEFPLYRSSRESFTINFRDQSDPFIELKEQAIAKSPCSNEYDRAAEKCYKFEYTNSQQSKVLAHRQDKLLRDNAASIWRCLSSPSTAKRDQKVSCSSSGHLLSQLSFSSQLEKQPSNFPSANASPTVSVLSNKMRIRWTQDLHEKFVECVNCLGGAEKATPKAILKLMDSDGLTIFHIKSHLQKYRIAKYMPDSAEGRTARRTNSNEVPQIDIKNSLQIREALQLQLDVQRHLHEQLEIQRTLQLRIEEQGRQLRMMFDQQQKSSNCPSKSESMNSLEDVHFSATEGLQNTHNTHFPSKIS
ncbi:myb family transcription factor RLI1 isoform X1 [Syzygium oleosum]|uniref:myb family transcription factor RLI1 isoform X1 n=1 Tax=Syzygium oleosum TaxID=219896 RepID=UPI0011D18FCC|nr:myb family transcription factor RLI1 isoform X1 [Syzygium oleosum]